MFETRSDGKPHQILRYTGDSANRQAKVIFLRMLLFAHRTSPAALQPGADIPWKERYDRSCRTRTDDAIGSAGVATFRDAARLQDPPDDFVIVSSWLQGMRQLGNALPVPLARVAGHWPASCLGIKRL